LETVKAAIERHENNLTQIPDAITLNKQEMMVKIKEGKAIHSSLGSILGLAKEDKQQITEVDALRLKAFEAIHNALNL
jgi:hypothetical protein